MFNLYISLNFSNDKITAFCTICEIFVIALEHREHAGVATLPNVNRLDGLGRTSYTPWIRNLILWGFHLQMTSRWHSAPLPVPTSSKHPVAGWPLLCWFALPPLMLAPHPTPTSISPSLWHLFLLVSWDQLYLGPWSPGWLVPQSNLNLLDCLNCPPLPPCPGWNNCSGHLIVSWSVLRMFTCPCCNKYHPDWTEG